MIFNDNGYAMLDEGNINKSKKFSEPLFVFDVNTFFQY